MPADLGFDGGVCWRGGVVSWMVEEGWWRWERTRGDLRLLLSMALVGDQWLEADWAVIPFGDVGRVDDAGGGHEGLDAGCLVWDAGHGV